MLQEIIILILKQLVLLCFIRGGLCGPSFFLPPASQLLLCHFDRAKRVEKSNPIRTPSLLQPVCPFSGTALARRWLVLRLQSPIRNGQPGYIRSAFLCHFDQAKRVEKSIFCCTSALLLAFRLPPAELRSAAPHSGPSQNLLRHHFVITCIFRAPPPALSGGGYVRLVAA